MWPVSRIRWAAVTEYDNSRTTEGAYEEERGELTEIKAWCPYDITQCLKELVALHERKPIPKVSLANRVKLFVGMDVHKPTVGIPWTDLDIDLQCSNLWGQCPSDMMSKSTWYEIKVC